MSWSELFVHLLGGLQVTAIITAASTVFGAICAFAGGIGKLSPIRAVRWLAAAYVEIFRGTSLLVQLFWLFFALPFLGVKLSPMGAGILGLSLNIGAYGAEVVRGAIIAVDEGQYEAAKALNFTGRQTLWRIVLPQAIVEMMPTFGNLAIQNLKDSSLVSLITLTDLTFTADNLRNQTLQTIPIFTLTLFIYFGLALILAGFMRWLEAKTERMAGRVKAS